MVRHRVRIRFAKLADLRLIGHRDLMRCLERLFRRAGLPLGMSEGFHPKPRMTFPLALSVGIEGTDEVMELELAEPLSADEVLSRMQEHVPPGLVLRSVEVLPPRSRKAHVRSVSYQVPIPPQFRAGLPERIEHLLAGRCDPIARARQQAPLELRPLVEDLTLRAGTLRMRLRAGSQQSAHPRDVLSALGLGELEQEGVHLTRTAVEIH